MLERIIEKDHQLFLYLNGLGNESWDSFWMTITNMYTWFPLYAVLIGLLFYFFSWKKVLLIFIFVMLGVLISDQTTNLLKDTTMRLRPCHEDIFSDIMRRVKAGCGGKHGFVSGHSSNHFFVALFLGFIFKTKLKWAMYPFIIWAMFIAYSRVYIGVHYPTDITLGALLGITVAMILLPFYFRIEKKYL